MSDPVAPPPEPPVAASTGLPAPLSVAASLVAVEGLVLGLLAVLEFASIDSSRRELGASTAVFFAAYAAVLLASAWALTRRSTWARGPALLTQLIAIGLAWSLRDHALVAAVLLVTGVVGLVGLVHPDTVAAFDRGHDSDAAED